MKNTLNCIVAILILTNNISSQTSATNNEDWLKRQFQLFNYQGVIDSLETKASSSTLSFDELRYLGLSYQNLFNFNRALKAFLSAKKLSEFNFQINYLAGKTAKQANNIQLAKGQFIEILEQDSTNKLAKIELANIVMENKKYTGAIELYSDLLKSDSSNSYFLTKIAYAYWKTRNISKAIKHYNDALEINPFDPVASTQLSKFYFESELFAEARSVLEEAIVGNTSNAAMSKMLAETLFKLKKYEAAVVYYTKSLALGDSSAGLFQRLGFSYYFIAAAGTKRDSDIFRQKMNEALDALNNSYKYDRQNPLTTLYLGICHKDLNNLEQAKFYFEQTLNLIFPDYIADVYTHLGATNELLNNLPSAISSYLEAYSYDPSNKVLLFYLGSAMDRYYADRVTPAIYYNKFLNEDTTGNTLLIEYAKERLEKLAEELHFNGN